MNPGNGRGHVLAIGLDATEPKLVQKLIAQGKMPTLKQLLSNGKWLSVDSSAWLGSGSVWPTFISGEEPSVHGVYGEWLWQPEMMGIDRSSGDHLTPFWRRFIDKDISLGILDVPFMPIVGVASGFEISEWGAHDVLEGKMRVNPPRIASRVMDELPSHPSEFSTPVSGPQDHRSLRQLIEACLNGIALRGALARKLLTEIRPQFSLITFTEIHRCSHYLWHTVEPDNEIYRKDEFANGMFDGPNLEDIYKAVDGEIAELVKAAGEETAIVVFSLHGMEPAHGIPAFLIPLLNELGFSRLADWRRQSWKDRVRTLIANLKRMSPASLKKQYYKLAPATTTHKVARTTVLPPYDWDHTQAFALPTDQHGWIRINLVGREARGIVPAKRYDALCRELQERLQHLVSENGRSLVRKVIRTADRVEDALQQRLPDLVVHWDSAVFDSPLRIKGSGIRPEIVGKKFAGRHSLTGFCIVAGATHLHKRNTLRASEMHVLMGELLGFSEGRNQVL